MWRALQYEEFQLPFIGNVARSQMGGLSEGS
jgi:hypothetical protein